MKKLLLLTSCVAFVALIHAQSFADDFESYNVGDPLAATSDVWESWSSPDGGADDTNISADNAHSGTKSLYFQSTSTNGGPQDCVLPFPGELQVGQFNYTMWMYINGGTGAYFNFQGEDGIGITWAAEVFFSAGNVQFTSSGSILLETEYPEDEWFELNMNCDMSTNTWEVLINGNSQGTYANTITQIASIDIYPVNGNQFYVDDVSYDFTDYELGNLNGAVTNVHGMTSALAGQTAMPSVEVRNLGLTTIDSFSLTVDYNGSQLSAEVNGVNIPSLAFFTYDFSEAFELVPGLNEVTAIISNINGMDSDDDGSDDAKTIEINPIVPAPGKVVVAEEATGTWCPWCVRGTVFMEKLATQYEGYYAGIAVHNADPMTVTEYDAAVSAAVSGYPSGFVDRGAEYDPSQFEIPFLERIQIAPKAMIENGAQFDEVTRVLDVSATVVFQENVSGNWKMAFVLTEDEVHGTGSTWAQANAYAGGANGVMGGFELLPNPVPAAQMYYDHVARALAPSFEGLNDAFAGNMDGGDMMTYNFTITLPDDWDQNNMHIIAMVIAPNGTIENAGYTTFSEALANGFASGTAIVGVEQLAGPDAQFSIYPNPADGDAYLKLQLENASDVVLEVLSADGKLVAQKSYGALSGAYTLPLNSSIWADGMYTIRLTTAGKTVNQIFVKH